MRFRVKKKCGRCKELMFHPYVHCKLGAVTSFRSKCFIPKPSDPVDCRDMRQAAYNKTPRNQERHRGDISDPGWCGSLRAVRGVV